MGIISGILNFSSFAIDTTSAIVNLASINQEIALNSDYTKTIFLWYLSKRPCAVMNESQYPKYLYYECGIQKFQT